MTSNKLLGGGTSSSNRTFCFYGIELIACNKERLLDRRDKYDRDQGSGGGGHLILTEW